MKVGVLVQIDVDSNIDEKFSQVKQMDMDNIQLVVWDQAVMTDKNAKNINEAKDKYGIEITAFWCGWEGPKVWDFYDGQITLGIVSEVYRYSRMQDLFNGSDFCKKLGVEHFVTHAGYIPENPYDPTYSGIISCLKHIAGKCKENGQVFLFETGQETPVTLKRAISDIGLDNLGINLDPANLIMYGKANPVDSLDVFGELVKGIHAKDGCYPTDGYNLGNEMPLGQGKVNFPEFIKKLKQVGYKGHITIEREISGEEQKKDIIMAKELLEKLI